MWPTWDQSTFLWQHLTVASAAGTAELEEHSVLEHWTSSPVCWEPLRLLYPLISWALLGRHSPTPSLEETCAHPCHFLVSVHEIRVNHLGSLLRWRLVEIKFRRSEVYLWQAHPVLLPQSTCSKEAGTKKKKGRFSWLFHGHLLFHGLETPQRFFGCCITCFSFAGISGFTLVHPLMFLSPPNKASSSPILVETSLAIVTALRVRTRNDWPQFIDSWEHFLDLGTAVQTM